MLEIIGIAILVAVGIFVNAAYTVSIYAWVFEQFKRKPKRLFYVKLSGEYFVRFNDVFVCDGVVHFGCTYKEHASQLSDTDYDRIKHLLPNDHTLELASKCSKQPSNSS